MSTPKTTFYLTNGNKLVDLFPLESNGPAANGPGSMANQSVPNEIFDIDYTDPTSANIVVFGDLTGRLVTVEDSTLGGVGITLTVPPASMTSMLAAGLTTGMFVDVPPITGETSSPLPNRTTVTSVDEANATITLSLPLTTAISAGRPVRFCFPFSIIDLDPSTPSPYVGDYGVASATFDGRVTSIGIAPSTPLMSAQFDVLSVAPGTNGHWVIQGLTNAREVFYPSSQFTITGNSLLSANTSYTTATTIQSDTYLITDVVVTMTGTVLTLKGNVGQFFTPNQQLTIALNTTHNGTIALNGTHTISTVGAYSIATDTTTVTIATIITGVTAPADGTVRPTLPTAVITVTGIIPNGAQPEGILTAGPVTQLPFKTITNIDLPPAITPNGPHTFIVSWRVGGDHTGMFAPGTTVTVKNNNYFKFKRLVIDSVNLTSAGGMPVTEVRTTVSDTKGTPVIGSSGSLIYPSPAVPYGHIQYTVATPATSLQLVGRGATHFNADTTWGQALQNNAIHQLENFADDIAPHAPLTGQLWFDTATPGLKINHNDAWTGVMVSGMPAQGSLNMNGHLITNVANATTDLDALNRQTGDLRYVNVTGDTMTGTLDMGTQKITNVADTVIPTGVAINLSTPNGLDALNVRTADARYVNVDGDVMLGELSMGGQKISHAANPTVAQDLATKSYVDSLTSGIVWLQPIQDPSLFDDTLASPPVIGDADMLFYRSYYVKPTAYAINGVNDALKIWSVAGDRRLVILPGHIFTVTGNAEPLANGQFTVVSTALNGADTWITVAENIPATAVIGGTIYHAGGSWNAMAGRIAAWTGSAWADVLERKVQVGDRFGVFFELDNNDTTSPVPGGNLGVGSALGTATKSAAGKIITVNTIAADYSINWGTGASPAFPPQTPAEPDAVSVLGALSPHYGHSYTFRGMWGTGVYNTDYKWIEFAGPSMLVDGGGLKYSGNVLNVGAGTGIAVTADAVNISTSYFNTNYMRRDGAAAFTANVSMGSHKLMDVTDPTLPQDAVTLNYLTTHFVSTGGTTAMTGNLNMNGLTITNLATPVNAADAVTMAYADTKVAKAGDTMTGHLTMSSASGLAYIDMGGSNQIVNLADPVNVKDAVNLQSADGRYVKKTGDTLTGPVTLSGLPTQPGHGANKAYVDQVAASTIATVQAAILDGGVF